MTSARKTKIMDVLRRIANLKWDFKEDELMISQVGMANNWKIEILYKNVKAADAGSWGSRIID